MCCAQVRRDEGAIVLRGRLLEPVNRVWTPKGFTLIETAHLVGARSTVFCLAIKACTCSLSKILGLSTITVGCGPGGTTPMLARVVLVDYRGHVFFSAFVQPTTAVTHYYRTDVTAEDLLPGNALPFHEVQKRVSKLISGRIIVGHTLWKNLSVLGLRHPAVATRDVALYQPFLNALSHNSQHPIGLQTLMWQLMRRHVQHHSGVDPVENARAAMDLYRSCEEEWEGYVSRRQWPSNAPPQNFAGLYL